MPAEAAPSWLFVPALDAAASRLLLPEDEAHYVARVCRAHLGDRVTATDGRGAVAELELTRIDGAVEGAVVRLDHHSRPREARVWCGAPESGRADWLVEKLAELGVARFQPLDTERLAWRGVRLERWRRLAIAALRQSRRPWLLEMAAPIPIAQALEALPGAGSFWLASATGGSAVAAEGPGLAIAAIGPAPGFSPPEIAAFEGRAFVPVRLANGRLRTETAALAWAAGWAAAE